MKFELLRTIDLMLDLYAKPRTFERFQGYLQALQGDSKGDLALPIQGFNPMAKEQALQKLTALKELDAEAILAEVCAQLTERERDAGTQVFRMALNLSDDLHGGWTNRYTSDYQGKFRINALVNRQFCTPIFWTGENYTPALVRERALEYAYRTLYWLHHPKPETLGQHVAQEQFVARKIGNILPRQPDFEWLQTFFQTHRESTDHALIFHFFYGEAASEALGMRTFGVKRAFAGFTFAQQR